MQGLNVIWVWNPAADKVLMCKRRKDPYKGLYNLVGGKIEPGEDGLTAAYRELHEETGITDIELRHLMDFTYYLKDNCRVEVYVGKLEREVEVYGDENELVWIDANENFFDMTRFAGEGNIGHIFEIVKQNGVVTLTPVANTNESTELRGLLSEGKFTTDKYLVQKRLDKELEP